MLRLRFLVVVVTALAVVSALLSCRGAANVVAAAPAAPLPKPKNAAAIAQAINLGRVGGLVYADRVRGHPLGARLAGMGVIRALFEGTGIDPQQDLERIFISAPSVAQGHRAVTVAQHHVPPARLKAAVEVMIARSQPPGAWLPDLGVPAARITVSRETRVIALIGSADGDLGDAAGPALLVVLPEDQAPAAVRFLGTGGFADPEGPEAAVVLVTDPHRTLRAPRVPRIPETLHYMLAKVHLTADGGMDVAMDALSASPEQATADAAALTESVERATTMRIAILTVRFFRPVVFRSETDHVTGRLHLTEAEIARLLGFADAFGQGRAGSAGSL